MRVIERAKTPLGETVSDGDECGVKCLFLKGVRREISDCKNRAKGRTDEAFRRMPTIPTALHTNGAAFRNVTPSYRKSLSRI